MNGTRTPNVGVLIGNIETPYARTLLSGMMEAAGNLPANLHVFPGMYERAYIGTMRAADHTDAGIGIRRGKPAPSGGQRRRDARRRQSSHRAPRL